ncbi:MAG: heavy-metal-associated domain-containing protein [Desulfobacteraceae bacterium]|nr:heavy-metal-associated domain-containing protein [Desulfobacteraceae bacterium]
MKKKHILITLVAVLSVFVISGFVVAENKDKSELKRAIFTVDNLTCGRCFTTINQSLEPKEGFSGFGANLFRKLVAVDFLPPLTAEAIAKTITDQGYPAKMDSVQNITEKESFAVVHAKRNQYSGCGGGGRSSCDGPPSGTTKGSTQKQTPYNSGGGSCCAAPPAN